jgi:glycosyltransferase involved in cell wall biosynthesis
MGPPLPASTAETADPGSSGLPAPAVEVVVPVFNESAGLRSSITRLHRFLAEKSPASWRITIADNASTDDSWEVAQRLAVELPGVRAVHLDRKGRGRALREVWLDSRARVVAYMDADLSTDLDALPSLLAPLLSGDSDLAIGSRLIAGARVRRGPKREVLSRGYNLLLRITLHSRVSDAQCGFKAVRAEVARALLPLVESDGWFFDTELLMLAERNRLRIHEVPVDWVDDPDSRVDIVPTVIEDIRGIWRLMRSFASGRGRVDGAIVAARPSSHAELRQETA